MESPIPDSVVVGSETPSVASALSRAKIWTADGTTDLHPATLDNPLAGIVGRSGLEGIFGNLQVGWGAGPITSNRTAPMVWRGAADSAAGVMTSATGQRHAVVWVPTPVAN